MLFKVVIQKPVIGKGKPTELDFIRNRRVLIVEAESTIEAGKRLRDAGEGSMYVSVERVLSRIVVLAP